MQAFRILLILAAIALSGCQTLYRPIITQGSQQALTHANQIKVGMSKERVANIMGTPLNVAPFDDDIWEYWFIKSQGSHLQTKQGIRLYFANDKLVRQSTIE